jgi:hypothetical protein
MMLKIACNSCGHAGIANSSTLPRELQCSRCGDRRHVAPKDCARIVNRSPLRNGSSVRPGLRGHSETKMSPNLNTPIGAESYSRS